MTLATIEVGFMIASLDLPVQLNLHIHDQQSWQASQAVSIDVLGVLEFQMLVGVQRINSIMHRAPLVASVWRQRRRQILRGFKKTQNNPRPQVEGAFTGSAYARALRRKKLRVVLSTKWTPQDNGAMRLASA